MILLTLFDVGQTLIQDGHAFPHVGAALTEISQFTTESGDTLGMAVVSDYGAPGVSEAECQRLEGEFQEILQQAGIDRFFQPFEHRVTISARAGVLKPDRRIFQAAALRSGTSATLGECLFITENRDHLFAARTLGMSILGFGHDLVGLPSFDDWRDAPMRIADIVGPAGTRNQERVINQALRDTYGVDNFKCLRRSGNSFVGQAQKLQQLDHPTLGAFDGIFVPMTVDVTIDCDANGRIDHVAVGDIRSDDVDETVMNVQQLIRRGDIREPSETSGRRGTHTVESDEQGHRVLRRLRYS